MWEKGAGDLDKAFEALSGAFRLDPDNEEARRALERLAESNGAWNQLVAVLDATIDETGNAERAVSLLIDSARVRERQGDAANAEERYQRALGMRPDDEAALSRLETVYRQSQRWGELATLLERRLHGLMERMPASEARKLRALELRRRLRAAWATPTRRSTPGRTWPASIPTTRRRSPTWRASTSRSASGPR